MLKFILQVYRKIMAQIKPLLMFLLFQWTAIVVPVALALMVKQGNSGLIVFLSNIDKYVYTVLALAFLLIFIVSAAVFYLVFKDYLLIRQLDKSEAMANAFS